jgi:hypothetical protein
MGPSVPTRRRVRAMRIGSPEHKHTHGDGEGGHPNLTRASFQMRRWHLGRFARVGEMMAGAGMSRSGSGPAAAGAGESGAQALERAESAFRRGDYRTVRILCARLAQVSDPEVRERTEALRLQVSVDPVHVGVLLGCLALWVALVYVYVL